MTHAARRFLPAFALSTLLAQGAAAGDARVLTDAGHVLTVGNWTLDTLDGGVEVRVADSDSLGWELRDGNGILQAEGLVPGSEGLGADAGAALSRSPLNGEIWLAWSRQVAPGASREIVIQRFDVGGWIAGSLSVVASDIDDQLDPALIHDEAGTAWMAWIDGAGDRIVRFAGLAPDGRFLGTRDVSANLSVLNGPPTLGIDAVGRLFLAHAGTPLTGGNVSLFVQAPLPAPVGITHLPDPILEFGLTASVPAETIGREHSGSLEVPSKVNLTVLGGTPVAWWTETDNGVVTRFRYVAEPQGDWSQAELRTVNMRAGTVATIPDALALIEARLRQVIPQRPGGPIDPINPPSRVGPGRLSTNPFR